MPKSLITTYALWAVGGPLGLHHLYLRRDSHALLWMLTLGGFGFGWLREFFRIPAYVSEANKEAERVRRPSNNPPPIGLVRVAGQVCVGIYFGSLALISLNSLNFFYLLVLPLSVGAGVHLVSSVGQQTSDPQKILTACIMTSAIFYGSKLSPLPISLAASVTAAQHRKFKLPQHVRSTPEPLGPRVYRLSLALLAFSAPLGYCVFHNTTATLYYISDCVAAFLDMFWFFPWLRGVVEYFLLLPYRILCAMTGGSYYEESWKKVLEILLNEYSKREIEAMKVLSVSEGATLEEISHSYRELAKLWHPDRNPKKKQEAEEMFIKINDAYETLLHRYKPQSRK
ncbi:dnaJ homolog subfamily C member 22 [Hemibagrus wyckioides]|nr:dnaJ homolog subfamily C member 22 [Hemibagrus wyckioides]XP_058265869.1 dnaJ homolog subfamily C member 22 [Hemibagrus wyckioides]XP_058265870.1 dnaJ homolog subfamily C member 22 [Hemibagrus wyckioides]XP_058265871.1 dnaJ homolog subfamily C member 22 [Hemibagrus wyckioides]XP_058265872.1 dnaJ homolog subfamily C member 22 [Hemibagrus wyckioides]XP_058265873.1 dnaJ homolog subfamily C member 22 [Hemibagrus wyckioides]